MANNKDGVGSTEAQLIAEIKEMTSREFVYEDGWCGMVSFGGELTEMQTGPPALFDELARREQADVLDSFIQWGNYPERAWNDHYAIVDNIEAGKAPEQWLEGTSIGESFRLLAEGKTPPPAEQCPEITWDDVRAALGMPEPQGKDQDVGKTLQEIMGSDQPEPEKSQTQERDGGREM